MLQRATIAATAGSRAKYATRGLAYPGGVDRTTRVLLLRQLYLAYFERRHFSEAQSVADQMVELGSMPDVARQDAARACLALGDADGAVRHLRLAGRVAPASRRAFHLWSLGSVMWLSGRSKDAAATLGRAARWGTTDRPLYQAQAALARLDAGLAVPDLARLRDALRDEPCGQGYGQLVLGELAFHLDDPAEARRLLRAFVRRTTSGRVALAVALDAEVRRARELLRRMARAGRES